MLSQPLANQMRLSLWPQLFCWECDKSNLPSLQWGHLVTRSSSPLLTPWFLPLASALPARARVESRSFSKITASHLSLRLHQDLFQINEVKHKHTTFSRCCKRGKNTWFFFSSETFKFILSVDKDLCGRLNNFPQAKMWKSLKPVTILHIKPPQSRRALAAAIKLRNWRHKIILDYLCGPNVIPTVLTGGRQEGHGQRKDMWWQKQMLE